MIEVKNLTKRYQETIALLDISFLAGKGEILGFLGPNGAGKTTTMKIVTGFLPATSGDVLIDEIPVNQESLATRKKIGYLAENNPLYEDMKVHEFLTFIGKIRGIKEEELNIKMKKAVEKCGLSNVINKVIGELSKGFRQRVGLAQAIIHEPEILILDEPTSGLDPNQIVEIRQLIKDLGRNKTVIFSTHILPEAQALCDRIIIVNKGKIVASGSASELLARSEKKESIYVKIKGPRENILHALNEMENVAKVEVKDKESEDVYGYLVESKEGVDLREYLSMTVMRNNWSILEFKQESLNLEDIFQELTKS